MADTTRGLPLLSGPPPSQDSSSSENGCRKCNKEFNVIFARSRKCNHCGYSYCHSCSDYQALMPRTGVDTGYDVMNVCAFCIEFLNITASGKNYLKSLPLAKLKRYINAYNIKIDRAVEKDDLIDAIITARAPNGCLPRSNEHYYRLYSVPNKSQARPRGLFSRSGQTSNAPPPPPPPRQPPSNPHNEFARPDLAPDHPPQPPYPPRSTRPAQQQQYNPPPQPPPRPHSAYPHSSPHNPPPQFHTPPPHGYYQQPQAPQNPYGRPPPQNYNTRPVPPHPPQASQPPPPPPPPRPRAASTAPPPTLARLLTMDTDDIRALSIHALKDILFTNHVNAGQILEKSDLVAKVLVLIEDEKRERERQRQAEEREQLELMRREEERREQVRERALAAERERQRAEAETAAPGATNASEENASEEAQAEMRAGDGSGENSPAPEADPVSSSPPKPTPEAPKAQGSAVTLERTGLCVICQDEEANIAIVDCGHMAMCRGCSDLIMASSRECPLCRTRIVTEARLLRIFRT